MSEPVTLVRWRDAEADPPTNDRVVWTNRGPAYYRVVLDLGCWFSPDLTVWFDPQPTEWCDPAPPSGDLRADLLTLSTESDEPTSADEWAEIKAAAVRVRAALAAEGVEHE